MGFDIAFLDHVAIRCKDPEASVEWYKSILGLTEYRVKEWGRYPVFLLAGKSGVAIFPEKSTSGHSEKRLLSIDHFAFNVDQENFEKAKKDLSQKGIDFNFQDHIKFHSIYFKDPDGHIVELTTLVEDKEVFYRNGSE